jgi:preprotein translocase subunit SecA
MFQGMMEGIKEESVGYLFNLEVQVEANSDDPEAQAQAQAATAQLNATSAQAMAATAQLKAKGLEAPKRPARLNYSAPTVDGEGGVVQRQEVNLPPAGANGEPQDAAAAKPKPKGRPPAPGGRRRKK